MSGLANAFSAFGKVNGTTLCSASTTIGFIRSRTFIRLRACAALLALALKRDEGLDPAALLVLLLLEGQLLIDPLPAQIFEIVVGARVESQLACDRGEELK